MNKATILLLGLLFGTGCYTQVRSTGDYWGYSGRRSRPVLVESDTTYAANQPMQQPYDSTQTYSDVLTDSDGGTPTIVNNYYDVAPWGHSYWDSWGYYSGPSVGISFSFGNPWYYRPIYRPYSWGWGSWYYDSWYWGSPYYSGYYGYDPFYWGGGIGYYPCVAPFYYPYSSFYRPYYGNGYASNVRTGRISGGEHRSGSYTGNNNGYNGTGSGNSGGRTSSLSGSQNRNTSLTSGSNDARYNGRTSNQSVPSSQNAPSNSSARSNPSSQGRYYNALPQGSRPPASSYRQNGQLRSYRNAQMPRQYAPNGNVYQGRGMQPYGGGRVMSAPRSYSGGRGSYGGAARSYGGGGGSARSFGGAGGARSSGGGGGGRGRR
ncbi:MAG TPA: hypothetical protein VEW28_09080 [Candidatus Kapabacteria bacterium]|nr:hypothetical protein [Candidatus Kapabacteria bacterium]